MLKLTKQHLAAFKAKLSVLNEVSAWAHFDSLVSAAYETAVDSGMTTRQAYAAAADEFSVAKFEFAEKLESNKLALKIAISAAEREIALDLAFKLIGVDTKGNEKC